MDSSKQAYGVMLFQALYLIGAVPDSYLWMYYNVVITVLVAMVLGKIDTENQPIIQTEGIIIAMVWTFLNLGYYPFSQELVGISQQIGSVFIPMRIIVMGLTAIWALLLFATFIATFKYSQTLDFEDKIDDIHEQVMYLIMTFSIFTITFHLFVVPYSQVGNLLFWFIIVLPTPVVFYYFTLYFTNRLDIIISVLSLPFGLVFSIILMQANSCYLITCLGPRFTAIVVSLIVPMFVISVGETSYYLGKKSQV